MKPPPSRSTYLRNTLISLQWWAAACCRASLLAFVTLCVLIACIAGAAPVQAASQAALAEHSQTLSWRDQFGVTSSILPRPTPCLVVLPAPHMLTPQQIAHPVLAGRRIDADGLAGRCISHRLPVPAPQVKPPALDGQVILVSLAQQWLWAYQDGTLVYATPVTTGRPELPTPRGIYHITATLADTTFYSPWGPWSPYYYAPEHIAHALLFRADGYYIHDAAWRHAFGPDTNRPHTDPDGMRENGSHGCVNVPPGASAWLYDWAQLGAAVVISA
ncbi:MAG TPA: L,D-transpeptidase family protein [Ktedonobacterales bacterium]|nr:L,D-transpeptidase family protein [Ktedonobacterales bacterium]